MSVNVRTIYDAQTFTSGQSPNPSLADTVNNTIEVEFLQGSISNNPVLLTYTTGSANFLGEWWDNPTTTGASAFIGTSIFAGKSFLPCIGDTLSDNTGVVQYDSFNPVPTGWFQFATANNAIDNLVIKVAAKENKKITGYTIYYHDNASAAGIIGITSGDNSDVHNSIGDIQMSTPDANWVNATEDTLASLKYTYSNLEITGTEFIYIEIDYGTVNQSVLRDPALIKLEFTVENDLLAPPSVTFPTSPVVYTNAQVNIADGNGWEYSINSGSNWIPGTGDSFQLSVGTYNEGTIHVRNTDGTQNSIAENNSSQIVVSPPPPTVNFPGSPALIQSATVTITSLGTGASGWQYSIDAGGNFSDGTGTTFSLQAGTYAQNQIQLRNGSGTNWSTTKNNSSQIVVSFSPPVVVFPGSGENGIVNITLGNSATAWQYSIDSGVSFSDGAGTKFTLQPDTYAIDDIQVRNGDGTNWSTTENNGSEIVISAPPTPPSEPVSTTETVDIRKSYYPESKVNSTSNSLFNKVYSQKLLTSVDKIERTPLALKKDKSVEQYHNGTQDRLLRIKSKAMNNQ